MRVIFEQRKRAENARYYLGFRLFFVFNGSTGAVVIDVPTSTSDLTNDSGYITDAGVTSVNGETGDVTISEATTSSAGLMSAEDKATLDTLADDYSSAITALG